MNKKFSHCLILIFIAFFSAAVPQKSVAQDGLLNYSSASSPGYTLFTEYSDTVTYLLDNCGFIVNTWIGSEKPSFGSYLGEDGLLYKVTQELDQHLEVLNWSGETIHYLNLAEKGIEQHHDIEVMPSGNILMLSKVNYTEAETLDFGFNPAEFDGQPTLHSEVIVECKINLDETLDIVWQWDAKDHLVQNFDPTKLNFGEPVDHPELLSTSMDLLSYDGEFTSLTDWLHFNSVDYNQSEDLILFSSRHTGEIYIIDHSTTKQEAAEHLGGNRGIGGDILYRWGNPQNYGIGTEAEQRLFGPHDAKFIPDGYGYNRMISVFNNGIGSSLQIPKSNVYIIAPENQGLGFAVDLDGQYLPIEAIDATENSEIDFYTEFIGGAQILPNGNVFVTEGFPGRILEFDCRMDLVWSYDLNITTSVTSWLFKAEKYPADFPGFQNIDLTSSNSLIEGNNPIAENCILFDSYTDTDMDGYTADVDCNDEDELIHPNVWDIPLNNIDENCDCEDNMNTAIEEIEKQFYIISNPVNDILTIQSASNMHLDLVITDIYGKKRKQIQIDQYSQIDVSNLNPGIYMLQEKKSAHSLKFIKE